MTAKTCHAEISTPAAGSGAIRGTLASIGAGGGFADASVIAFDEEFTATASLLSARIDADAQQTGCGSLAGYYYDASTSDYLVEVKSRFMRQSPAQIKRRLKHHGVSSTRDMTALSDCDRCLIEIEDDKAVDYAGPLAGYDAGVHNMCGHRVLVTESPKIITPTFGDWPLLRGVIESLLRDDQAVYFYGWTQCAYRALTARTFTPGQALALAGPKDCGKSLLQKIITEILGGRCARPYQFMTGASPFNADLFGAEHLMVEDEAAQTGLQARRTFGALIKSCSVNEEQRLHAKGRDAVMLRPFWRLSITTNDEAENLMVLPPIDASLEDKVMLLKATRAEIPMPTGTPDERRLFWSALVAELPAFLQWLTAVFAIPAQLRSERFGIRHYHHPELLEHLDDLAPETRLLRLLDVHVVTGDQWTGTASELQSQLTAYDSACVHEARKLLDWSNACGVYLGRLATKYPERVIHERTRTERRWTVHNAALLGKGVTL